MKQGLTIASQIADNLRQQGYAIGWGRASVSGVTVGRFWDDATKSWRKVVLDRDDRAKKAVFSVA